MIINMTKNAEKNGIEVTFSEKPEQSILETLKQSGFRWHRVKKLWYAKDTEERVKTVETLQSLADGKPAPVKESKPVTEKKSVSKKKANGKVKKNKFGVKVGDLFEASWGYDQTNIDFFQVVKLCGEKSVRVVQVYPKMIESNPTCSMAADETYENSGELLPHNFKSMFIKDQENGDLKRLKSYDRDGVSCPEVDIDKVVTATLVTGNRITCYHSWYA